MGEAAPIKGSSPKNDHLLGVLEGLGVPALSKSGAGSWINTGIELRLRGDPAGRPSALILSVRSRTAPAVLGLESVLILEGLRERGTVGSRSAWVEPLRDMMDEMLPDREWPGRAVTVLDVSLDTSDSGLGINSSVSENPTRARLAGLVAGLGSSTDSAGDGIGSVNAPPFLGLGWL